MIWIALILVGGFGTRLRPLVRLVSTNGLHAKSHLLNRFEPLEDQ